jgi:hypothetical protein
MESGGGLIRATYGNVAAVVAVLEAAGIEFLDNDSPGVRLRPGLAKPSAPSKPTSHKQAKPAAKPLRGRTVK